MSPEDHRRLRLHGSTTALATLFNIAIAPNGPEGAESFAIGMIHGARDWLAAHVGEKRTYEIMQPIADRLAETLVKKTEG